MPTRIYKHKPLTEEHKKKIGLFHRGKKVSIETRQKQSRSHIGKIPWNKNKKTGIIPKHAFKKGHISWNAGKKGLCLNTGNTHFKKGHIPWIKGKRIIPWNKGKKGQKVSTETRKKMSEGMKKSMFRNKNWKGGISSFNNKIRNGIEYRLWRESVFARDNWTCQDCHVRGGRIYAHHLKSFSSYPELRFAIDNGKTLCKKCHDNIHKGRKASK